ncbi:Imm1 family immunity protein [Kitasatospora sp. NPDC002965]|uniref:Imm1 family immunity protein n=1 Tax=Kitasatospora sp. NPDC002965 TaxID=3154775 RepID=UPI0033B55E0C
MILQVSSKIGKVCPSNRDETIQAVSEAVQYSRSKRQVVSFVLIEPPSDFPAAHLNVSISEDRSHGALVWCASEHLLERGGVYSHIWISDNPEPPTIDPDLVSDTYTGRTHDPASTLPMHRVVAAIEEYCLAGTGERPSCVEWVTGELTGQRHDRPIVRD